MVSYSLLVAAQDTQPPIVTSCPQPITRIIPIGSTSQIVTWVEPTATDSSGVTPTISQTHQPGASFPVGTTQVSYTFTDPTRNSAMCIFTVTISEY